MVIPAVDLTSEISILRQENSELKTQNRVLIKRMEKIWEQNQELMQQNQKMMEAYREAMTCMADQNKKIKNLEELINSQPTKKTLWGAFAAGVVTALSGVASLFLVLK